MPGHIKKSEGPDPDPDHWLYVSYELKEKNKVILYRLYREDLPRIILETCHFPHDKKLNLNTLRRNMERLVKTKEYISSEKGQHPPPPLPVVIS